MNILIASSQMIVTRTLLTLLRFQPDMRVTGTARSAAELLRQAQTAPPDLVLVEWDLLAGSPALGELRRLPGAPRVLVYGHQIDCAPLALAAGADIFFWEGQGPKSFLTACRRLFLEAQHG